LQLATVATAATAAAIVAPYLGNWMMKIGGRI